MRCNKQRRRVLKAAGTGVAVSLTGCLGSITGSQESGPIPIGAIHSTTGRLGPFGQNMQKSAGLAVEDANDAGGPLDREVNYIRKDAESKTSVAVQAYKELVNEDNAPAFVGAITSGTSTALAQRVAGDQVMEVSQSATSPSLVDIGWKDDLKYFGRTCTNDAYQGVAMASVMNGGDYGNYETAAFLYIDNAYGQGLVDKAAAAFEGEVTAKISYDPTGSDYSSTLDSVFQDDPDIVGFAGYAQSGKTIFNQWQDGGYGGTWVLSSGVNNPEFLNEAGSYLEGNYLAKVAYAEGQAFQTFVDKFGSSDFTAHNPHAYDAMFLILLAIEKSGEATGTSISKAIREISRPEGETVTIGEFGKAKDLISEGTNINYQGASGPVNLNRNYEPIEQFSINEIQSNGDLKHLKTLSREYLTKQVEPDPKGKE